MRYLHNHKNTFTFFDRLEATLGKSGKVTGVQADKIEVK
jgi:hypothetical protein